MKQRRRRRRRPRKRTANPKARRNALRLPVRLRRRAAPAARRQPNFGSMGMVNTLLVGTTGFFTPALLSGLVRYYFVDQNQPDAPKGLPPASWTQLGLECGFAWLTNQALWRFNADDEARGVYNVGQITKITTTALSLLLNHLPQDVRRFTGIGVGLSTPRLLEQGYPQSGSLAKIVYDEKTGMVGGFVVVNTGAFVPIKEATIGLDPTSQKQVFLDTNNSVLLRASGSPWLAEAGDPPTVLAQDLDRANEVAANVRIVAGAAPDQQSLVDIHKQVSYPMLEQNGVLYAQDNGQNFLAMTAWGYPLGRDQGGQVIVLEKSAIPALAGFGAPRSLHGHINKTLALRPVRWA